MFVEFVHGKVANSSDVRAAFARLAEEVRPSGWLGTTAGVTEHGTCVALVRWTSADAAQCPERKQWWAETERLFTGEVELVESRTAEETRRGAAPEATFVQVIRRRVRDVARAREVLALLMPVVEKHRPEDLGTVVAEYGDDSFIVAVYFTSEQEARGTEREPAPELHALRQEQRALSLGPTTFYDLRDPWHYSPL